MPVLLSDIKMPLDAPDEALCARIETEFALPGGSVRGARIVRQSLDARRKSDIHFLVSTVVMLEPSLEKRLLSRGGGRAKPYAPVAPYALPAGKETPRGRIAVVGLGPAGLFAAYFLALAGYAPLVLERGREVGVRARDVGRFWDTGVLDPESNVMFGEGGAGTFSDGKLTTRIKDPRADAALETLARFGAPPDIVYQAKPHIGTDLLRDMVHAMRLEIERLGGEVRFGARLADIRLEEGTLRGVTVEQNGNAMREECAACVLATGQAARDTYEMLLGRGLSLAPKAFAVGVRIEHPQEMIDRAQFGVLAGHPRLGAAEYRLTGKSGERGVYTFCMCPGGAVVNASSGPGEAVVNGMSNRARNGVNANAAVVVQVGPADFSPGPLGGVRFQQELERRAYLAGLPGGEGFAPAQRAEDFLKRRTGTLGDVWPTCRPGVQMANLTCVLPDFVAKGVADGIRAFGRQLAGFDLPDAVLTAVESRTSAPVRILRDGNGEAIGARGLYPVGEGAGYAGGIVSAAVDGMHAAEQIAARYKPGAR